MLAIMPNMSDDSIDTNRPQRQVHLSRMLSLIAAAGLVALGLAWELVLAPTGGRTWALKVLPLVVALPGLWRMRLYTYRWLSLAVWLYFTEGAVRATSERGVSSSLGWAQAALSVALFIGCSWHVRARLRAGRAAEPQAIDEAAA